MNLTLTAWQVVLFGLCVVAATSAQTITGFAFAVILIGLVGLLKLMPLADAVNVATVLGMVNALVALRGARGHIDLHALRDTGLGLAAGIGAGVLLLGWLSTNVVAVLQVLLGVTIIGCAVLLLARTVTLPARSGRWAFMSNGLLAGLLGGLFSASGPPMVFHYYRQPLALDAVRTTLIALLALASAIRLVMVLARGQFSANAFLLCVLAVPLVMLATAVLKRYPPGWPREKVLRLVFVLLVLTGIGLIVPVVV